MWLEVVRFHVAEQMKGQVAQLPNAKPKALRGDSKGKSEARPKRPSENALWDDRQGFQAFKQPLKDAKNLLTLSHIIVDLLILIADYKYNRFYP